MPLIPGSIPVTGFIAPTDTTDTYPVTDAIYGIDGMRNVADHTERNYVSLERRRAGMVVGTLNDGKYWRLKNQSWTIGDPNDWELFLQVGPSGSVVNTGLKYVIESTDDIVIPTYTQYWIYGDLTIEGTLTNYGEVIIADGGLVLNGGTFSNFGTLILTSITNTFVPSDTITFSIVGSTVSARVIHGSLTASHFNTGTNGGATAGYVLSNDGSNFKWIQSAGDVSGTPYYLPMYDTLGTGLTDSLFSQISIGTVSLNGNLSIDNAGWIEFTNISNTNTIRLMSSTTSATYNLFLPLSQGTTGYVLANDGNGYLYWTSLVSGGSYSVMTVDDKNLIAVDTVGDMQFSGATISNTPIDDCYVAVFVNGLEFEVGNGSTSSSSCYFSGNSGVDARGFSSLHPNGKVQSNDGLYWNESVAGVPLTSGWKISLHYLTS